MFLINEITAFLAVNVVFMQALGTGEMISVIGSRKKLLVTSLLTTLFTTAGSVPACIANVLITEKYYDFRLFFYVLFTGILYIVFMRLSDTGKFAEYKSCVYISAFGSAAVGTFLNISGKASGFGECFLIGLNSGIGFAAAALILAAAYRKLVSVKVPSVFRGLPAMLVYMGIISMAVRALG